MPTTKKPTEAALRHRESVKSKVHYSATEQCRKKASGIGTFSEGRYFIAHQRTGIVHFST